MTRHVAFLRAINVGRRRVAMRDLVEVVEGAGHADVRTFINTGNVAFTSRKQRASLERSLETAFAEAFGFEVPTFVRTRAEVEAVAGAQPFAVPEGHTHLVAFLRPTPTPEVAAAIVALATSSDELVVDGDEVHWHIHGTSMDTAIKDSAWRRTGVGLLTTRNITMLRKLAATLSP